MLTNNTHYRLFALSEQFILLKFTHNLTQIKNVVFAVSTIRDYHVWTKSTSPFFQTEVNFGKDIADNSWHFVVFTVDPVESNEVQFYLDGDRAGNPQ